MVCNGMSVTVGTTNAVLYTNLAVLNKTTDELYGGVTWPRETESERTHTANSPQKTEQSKLKKILGSPQGRYDDAPNFPHIIISILVFFSYQNSDIETLHCIVQKKTKRA